MKAKTKRNEKSKFKLGMIAALVIGMMLAYTVYFEYVHITYDEETKSWHIIFEGNIARAVEHDWGVEGSGILEIFIMNSTGTDAGARAENTSLTIEGWCDANNLGYCSNDDTEIDIAHSTNFELWVRVRGNQTVCMRGSDFFDSDLKVEITWSDESLSDASMTGYVTHNVSSEPFLYVNFVLIGPYTITKGVTSEIENIKYSAYY